jgi:hypothetical protein
MKQELEVLGMVDISENGRKTDKDNLIKIYKAKHAVLWKDKIWKLQ